jgi:hypothetical protein
MFRNHHISRYFSRVGLSKDRHLGASLDDSNGQSGNVVSIGAIGVFAGSPIALSDISEPGGLWGGSVASSSHSRVYLVNNPHYVHPVREIAKHAYETQNSICN